jgi:hypothetical protein
MYKAVNAPDPTLVTWSCLCDEAVCGSLRGVECKDAGSVRQEQVS